MNRGIWTLTGPLIFLDKSEMVELSSLFCGNISIRLDIFKRKPPHPFNFKKGQSIMPHFLWFTSQGASINYAYRILRIFDLLSLTSLLNKLI